MNRLASRGRMAEMGGMGIFASGAAVYVVAGIAIGVALTMVLFSIAVAIDRARLRRGIRRARAAASIAPGETEAIPDTAADMPPTPEPKPGARAAEPVPEPATSTSPPPTRAPTVEELFAEAFGTQTETRPEPTSSDPSR